MEVKVTEYLDKWSKEGKDPGLLDPSSEKYDRGEYDAVVADLLKICGVKDEDRAFAPQFFVHLADARQGAMQRAGALLIKDTDAPRAHEARLDSSLLYWGHFIPRAVATRDKLVKRLLAQDPNYKNAILAVDSQKLDRTTYENQMAVIAERTKEAQERVSELNSPKALKKRLANYYAKVWDGEPVRLDRLVLCVLENEDALPRNDTSLTKINEVRQHVRALRRVQLATTVPPPFLPRMEAERLLHVFMPKSPMLAALLAEVRMSDFPETFKRDFYVARAKLTEEEMATQSPCVDEFLFQSDANRRLILANAAARLDQRRETPTNMADNKEPAEPLSDSDDDESREIKKYKSKAKQAVGKKFDAPNTQLSHRFEDHEGYDSSDDESDEEMLVEDG
jgi:hypothetical protein